MGKEYRAFTQAHAEFIADQEIFFVGTAAGAGQVNISPKGMDSLRVLGPNRVVWRNLTGSGNETAGHLLKANRITLMWCSFKLKPLILRAYGTAEVHHLDDPRFRDMNVHFDYALGARQIYDVKVDSILSSCGYGVPFFEHVKDRDTLTKWAEDKGAQGLRDYWSTVNATTIDGFPTGLGE